MDIKFSNKVKILPWIGNKYPKTNPKILVLGMSTYNHGDPKKTCVRIMAKKVSEGNREKWARYWNRITTLLKNDNEEVNDFWNRISFHNYIQKIMDEPKQKNHVEDWENAKEPFMEIIEKLVPDIVIVTGYATFDHLPDECIRGRSIKKNGKELKIGYCKIGKKTVNICGMWHPATYGFRYADWRSLYKKFYIELKK
jgi:hypothetical protein